MTPEQIEQAAKLIIELAKITDMAPAELLCALEGIAFSDEEASEIFDHLPV